MYIPLKLLYPNVMYVYLIINEFIIYNITKISFIVSFHSLYCLLLYLLIIIFIFLCYYLYVNVIRWNIYIYILNICNIDSFIWNCIFLLKKIIKIMKKRKKEFIIHIGKEKNRIKYIKCTYFINHLFVSSFIN